MGYNRDLKSATLPVEEVDPPLLRMLTGAADGFCTPQPAERFQRLRPLPGRLEALLQAHPEGRFMVSRLNELPSGQAESFRVTLIQ